MGFWKNLFGGSDTEGSGNDVFVSEGDVSRLPKESVTDTSVTAAKDYLNQLSYIVDCYNREEGIYGTKVDPKSFTNDSNRFGFAVKKVVNTLKEAKGIPKMRSSINAIYPLFVKGERASIVVELSMGAHVLILPVISNKLSPICDYDTGVSSRDSNQISSYIEELALFLMIYISDYDFRVQNGDLLNDEVKQVMFALSLIINGKPIRNDVDTVNEIRDNLESIVQPVRDYAREFTDRISIESDRSELEERFLPEEELNAEVNALNKLKDGKTCKVRTL